MVAGIVQPGVELAGTHAQHGGDGGVLGGIEWGFAADDEHLYVPISDVWENRATPGHAGGIYKLRFADGTVWNRGDLEARLSAAERLARHVIGTDGADTLVSGAGDDRLDGGGRRDGRCDGVGGGGGAEVVASCHDVPETRFLALSVSDASDDVVGVIRAGARGYVTKAISNEDLAQAVRRVAAGDAAFSPRLAGFVLDAFGAGTGEVAVADTELDRQVLDLIKDPLTHMVRNSADHGLEMPEDRVANGKSETGTITLRAYHEGGHIIIEIADDGHGLNTARIREKVIENGLATPAELDEKTDAQIHKYIFAAGFSTAAAVTNVSGRGVGMDVVRTNIELIGGSIDLASVAGKGTTFTIKIPLTLAIVSSLIVESGAQRFAIPQLAVVELVRAKQGSDSRIERINDTPVLRLRNNLLPLVYLDELLLLNKNRKPDEEGNVRPSTAERSESFVIVSQVGNSTFGIVVDTVFDTEEIVVKPSSTMLRDITMFSGNTILGDGSVIMIIDPNGIAQCINREVADQLEDDMETEVALGGDERTSLLIFRAGNGEPKAVPLSLVTRLEEVAVDEIEMSDGKPVVQYRGKLMPLQKVMPSQEMRDAGRQPVLVFTDDGRSMGLVVDEIVDVIDAKLDLDITSQSQGMLGSAIVREKATEIIDVAHFLTLAFEDWFARADQQRDGAQEKRLLLVDDSPFFRNMLAPLLNVAGYKVTTAADPHEAFQLRDAGAQFDVIISDIEMPGMDGFDFAEAVKSDSAWGQTPIVAMSSRTSREDIERGHQVGFSDYVAKTDRDGLIDVLRETLEGKGAAA